MRTALSSGSSPEVRWTSKTTSRRLPDAVPVAVISLFFRMETGETGKCEKRVKKMDLLGTLQSVESYKK